MHKLEIKIGEPRVIRGIYYDYGTFGGIGESWGPTYCFCQHRY